MDSTLKCHLFLVSDTFFFLVQHWKTEKQGLVCVAPSETAYFQSGTRASTIRQGWEPGGKYPQPTPSLMGSVEHRPQGDEVRELILSVALGTPSAAGVNGASAIRMS